VLAFLSNFLPAFNVCAGQAAHLRRRVYGYDVGRRHQLRGHPDLRVLPRGRRGD
jgi:hypothetical protein